MKKRSERRKHCAPAAVPHRRTESAMAVVRQSQKNFPAADPCPGAQNRQNLNSWRWSLPSPTDPVWWRSMHAISSYRCNRHRPPATNTQTQIQDRLQYTAPLASAQCKNINECSWQRQLQPSQYENPHYTFETDLCRANRFLAVHAASRRNQEQL